jgi:hypothetical protein
MSQRNNPFSKLIPNPSNIPDPKNMTTDEFIRYNSHEMEKLQRTMRVLKRSMWYVGGCAGFILALSFFAERYVRNDLFGVDSKLFCDIA